MSWFEKIDAVRASVPKSGTRVGPRRRLDQVSEAATRSCTATSWSATCRSVRSVIITCVSRARRSDSSSFSIRKVATGTSSSQTSSLEDPLKFRDSKRYRDRIVAGAKEDGRERRADQRCRQAARQPGRCLRFRVFIYGRVDGAPSLANVLPAPPTTLLSTGYR